VMSGRRTSQLLIEKILSNLAFSVSTSVLGLDAALDNAKYLLILRLKTNNI
jgi:hypothetical protein